MPVQIKTKVLGPGQNLPYVRCVPHDLFRHTPNIDTGATQILPLNHTDFGPVRGSTTGRGDATAAGTDDEKVEVRGVVAAGGGGAEEGAAGPELGEAGDVFLCRGASRRAENRMRRNCEGEGRTKQECLRFRNYA